MKHHASRPSPRARVVAAWVLVAAMGEAAGSFRGPAASAADEIAQLKREYLACERAAAEAALPPSVGAQCSAVYESLKEKAFGGDFERLHGWWRATLEGERRATARPSVD